jgi:hypothetical protein
MKFIAFLLLNCLSLSVFGQAFTMIYNNISYPSGGTADIDCSTSVVSLEACATGFGTCLNGSTCTNWQLPTGWSYSTTGTSCIITVTPNSTTSGQLKTKLKSGSSFYDLTLDVVRKIPTIPSISPSPILICNGGNQNVTAGFTPFTYSYTWGSEGGASVSSTGFSTGNVTATASGKAKVRADADPATGCPNSGWQEAYVHYGVPTVDGITVNSSMCSGYGQVVTANVLGNPTSLSWAVIGGNSSNAYLTDYGAGSAYFNSYVPDCYGLQISMSNSCGNSSDGTTICVDNCFARYSVYPNPTKDYISVHFEQFDKARLLPEQLTLYREKTQESVYDIANSQIVASLNKEGVLQIPVKNLPRGTYYLHMISGEKAEQKTGITRIILE